MKFRFKRPSVFKVNPGSSFEQIWKYSSNQCRIPSFKIMIIGLLVPEKNILKGFYHIWTWRPSWSCDINHLYSLLLTHQMEAVSIGLAVSKEKKFEKKVNLSDLGPRSMNDL